MQTTASGGHASISPFWRWFLILLAIAAIGSCVWHIHAVSIEYDKAFKVLEDKGFYEGSRPFIDVYGGFALSLLVAVIALLIRISMTREGFGTPARWIMIGFIPLTLLAGWTEMFVTTSFNELQAAADGLLRYDEDSILVIFFGAPLYLIASLVAWPFSFGAYSTGANLKNTDLTRNHILLYFWWFVIAVATFLSIFAIVIASSTADRYAAISHTAISLLWFYYASAIGIGRTHKLNGKRTAELAHYYRFGAGEEG